MESRRQSEASQQEAGYSKHSRQSEAKDEDRSEASMETVEVEEIVRENEELQANLDKANKEIERLRNNLCDVSDIVDRNDLDKSTEMGKTFDYGIGRYATGDVDNPNLPDSLSKTFDMGVRPVVIPVLDFKKLKQVKHYKDWYGYAQKLEYSVKLLRDKIKKLEASQMEFSLKYTKLRSQNQRLFSTNQTLNQTIKKLKEKVNEHGKWRNKFEMTMPNMGPNYVSFTMMDMHKTINNQKNEIVNVHKEYNMDGSFNSDIDPSSYEREINQFSHESGSKEKDSSGRIQKPHHKKSQSMAQSAVKVNKSYIASNMYDPADSPGFTMDTYKPHGDDIKISKSQIKNPKDINKYVRNKKRGHLRKKSQMVDPGNDNNKTFDMTSHGSFGKIPAQPKKTIKELMYGNTYDEGDSKPAKVDIPKGKTKSKY